MRGRRTLGFAFAALALVAVAQGAWAAPATEQLKSAIYRVLATVDNPAQVARSALATQAGPGPGTEVL